MPMKLKSKPTMASMSYLLKFTFREISSISEIELRPGKKTIQCHLEIEHTKMTLNF